MLLSLSSPTHPSSPVSSYLPLTESPRPSEEAASHKLTSGQCARGGALLLSVYVWGAESRGRRVAECTHQVSMAHQSHVQMCSSERIHWVMPGMGLGSGRKQRMGVGEDISQKAVGTGWLWSFELVRNPYCKIPSSAPCTGAQSWASQRGKHPREPLGDPRKPLWRRHNAHSCGNSPAPPPGLGKKRKREVGKGLGGRFHGGLCVNPLMRMNTSLAHLCAL